MRRLVFLLMGSLFISCQPVSEKMHSYPVRPVPFTKVQVTDAFWAERIQTNHEVTIPIAIQKSRETGRIRNFEIAGGLTEGVFCSPYPFDDSDVYKIIEGAAYSLQMFPDKALEATIDSLVSLIELAQEEDGYLFTNRTIMGENGHEWIGKERWVNVDDLSHELYNLGHFYEAATAWYQATGKRKILDIALRSADLVDREFGYGKIENYPGHQEIEIGLVKLFNATGEKRYLDLAKFFLDIRGKGELGKKTTYNQSHLPVVEQTEAVGHSVRAAYMWTGMADVAALTGDKAYIGAISRIWEDVVYKKFYITGGIGAAGGHEGFGGPYELPNMRAYCETCAAIANVFWNHRMFLMTGDAQYIDVLERSLYNNILSGVSLSGDRFFYPNPLESQGQHQRSEWFGCACCPSNISRFIPSMPTYIYAHTGRDIYLNLYVPSQTTFRVDEIALQITQESNMPWEGRIHVSVDPEQPVRAGLKIRIPCWASRNPVPGDLYAYLDPPQTQTLILCNGKRINAGIKKGYATITRTWHPGDKVEILFPLEIRKIKAHPEIVDDQGKIAYQRGPLVYCAEWADYTEKDILSMYVEPDEDLTAQAESALLGGVVTLNGKGYGTEKMEDGTIHSYPRDFKAIPYYAWAHRGSGQMMVWIPSGKEYTRPKPAATLASTSRVEASYETSGLMGINDGILPKNSRDETHLFYHWWPDKGTTHWIVYNFQNAETVHSTGVYWFVDLPSGGCGLPKAWKMYYKSGNSWQPVKSANAYGLEKDAMNTVAFEPVTTSAMKLEIILSEEYSAGIHEWEIQ
jgi:uncharacterized protein